MDLNPKLEPLGNWDSPFRSLFRHIITDAEKENHLYPDVLCKGTRHIIPFFGDAERATVLTIGINPSGGEFNVGRYWEADKDDPGYLLYLLSRLTNYFSLKVRHHKFFDVWERGLKHLGHSYYRDSAHVDVSPRPLLSMQTIRKLDQKDSSGRKPRRDEYLKCKSQFEQALASDINWLFDLFAVLPSLKCILMAGNLIISPPSLDLWIKKNAPQGWEFRFNHPTDREAKPKRSFGILTAPKRPGEPNRHYGFFWCSVSPNAGAFGSSPEALVDTIASNIPAFQRFGCVASPHA